MQLHDLPPIKMPGGGSAGKALLDEVPQGDVIDGFLLKFTGTTNSSSNLNAVRVIIGGKDAVNVSGPQMDKINGYLGHPANATYMPIWFADPLAATRQAYSETALDTLNRTYSNIQIVLEYDGGQSSDANVEARLMVGSQKVGPKEQMEDIRDTFRALLHSQENLASGVADFQLPLGTEAGASIHRAYFFGSNITEVEVKRDGVNLMDRLPVADIRYVQSHERTPQTDMQAFDPILSNLHSRSVPTLRPNGTAAPFRWILNLSAGETVEAISDIATTINRL
jgi:hypothetical protein